MGHDVELESDVELGRDALHVKCCVGRSDGLGACQWLSVKTDVTRRKYTYDSFAYFSGVSVDVEWWQNRIQD